MSRPTPYSPTVLWPSPLLPEASRQHIGFLTTETAESLSVVAMRYALSLPGVSTVVTERKIAANWRRFGLTDQGGYDGVVENDAFELRAKNMNSLNVLVLGAVLDVYTEEFTGPPPEELWRLPNVLITPHTSVGTDVSHARGTALFCQNPRRSLNGDPLLNVIDWARGY